MINWIEVGFSAIPGFTATIAGESFSYTNNNAYKRVEELNWEAVLQIGGGIFSNAYGKAADEYLDAPGVEKAVKEFWKFAIESGSNAAPDLAPDEKKAP